MLSFAMAGCINPGQTPLVLKMLDTNNSHLLRSQSLAPCAAQTYVPRTDPLPKRTLPPSNVCRHKRRPAKSHPKIGWRSAGRGLGYGIVGGGMAEVRSGEGGAVGAAGLAQDAVDVVFDPCQCHVPTPRHLL